MKPDHAPQSPDFAPTQDDLFALFREKYCSKGEPNWGPRMRLAHGYFTPDDIYESLISNLVFNGAYWLDVGCGRDIFPSNLALARRLAEKCAKVVGVDPDPNVHDNPVITEGHQCLLENLHVSDKFDLITLRMVAEHVENPIALTSKLAQLAKPNGRVVIYTPNKWAPVSLLAAATPFALHNPVKWLLWRTESRDTFPTQYKMNTRRQLQTQFSQQGFAEVYFAYLDDCRTSNRFRPLNFVELRIQQLCHRFGRRYPENCLLGVYEKRP